MDQDSRQLTRTKENGQNYQIIMQCHVSSGDVWAHAHDRRLEDITTAILARPWIAKS